MNRLPALLIFAALPACTREEGSYPSLSPRPVEKLGFEEPMATPPSPVRVDPALDLEVAAGSARLEKAASDFARAADRAQAAATRARGAATGTEAWIEAQTALAELDGLRAETSEVLSDLERLAIDRAATLAPDYPALQEALERARTELQREDATIRRLGSALAPA